MYISLPSLPEQKAIKQLSEEAQKLFWELLYPPTTPQVAHLMTVIESVLAVESSEVRIGLRPFLSEKIAELLAILSPRISQTLEQVRLAHPFQPALFFLNATNALLYFVSTLGQDLPDEDAPDLFERMLRVIEVNRAIGQSEKFSAEYHCLEQYYLRKYAQAAFAHLQRGELQKTEIHNHASLFARQECLATLQQLGGFANRYPSFIYRELQWATVHKLHTLSLETHWQLIPNKPCIFLLTTDDQLLLLAKDPRSQSMLSHPMIGSEKQPCWHTLTVRAAGEMLLKKRGGTIFQKTSYTLSQISNQSGHFLTDWQSLQHIIELLAQKYDIHTTSQTRYTLWQMKGTQASKTVWYAQAHQYISGTRQISIDQIPAPHILDDAPQNRSSPLV